MQTPAKKSALPSASSSASSLSAYWSYTPRRAEKRDLGHKCRECKRAFRSLGEPLVVRRGGRIEMRYHEKCFSGTADPRTQSQSSFHTHPLGASIPDQAPTQRYTKMRTASHW